MIPTWRNRAACRGLDPEIFFSLSEEETDDDATAAAKAVCSECPVQEPCLEHALGFREKDGVWGGYTEKERRRLVRQRRRTA